MYAQCGCAAGSPRAIASPVAFVTTPATPIATVQQSVANTGSVSSPAGCVAIPHTSHSHVRSMNGYSSGRGAHGTPIYLVPKSLR